jgi:hypothetical protein
VSPTGRGTDAARPSTLSRRLAVAVVAAAAAPVAVAALSLVGDTWHPVGDWASMLFRTGQVGSSDTPLVGTYTVKGWAHPGPFLYYATTPLHRLTGGDPRSMAWTAAILNAVTIVAIGAVAWRRGRLALTVAAVALVALLVRGLGPERLVDLWNPYLGLLPFLLVVLLAWDAALGRPRSVAVAALPAVVAVQCHVSFVPLIGVVAVWLVCWCRWWPRLVPPGESSPGAPTAASATSAAPAGAASSASAGGLRDVAPPRPPWRPWRRAAGSGLVVAAVVSLPPLLDLVLDTHNAARVVHHLARGAGEQVGLVDGLGLVSRAVRPDGPWLGGAEPSSLGGDAVGSGPLVTIAVLALLGGCLRMARDRGLVDVAALASLSIVLVVAAVPAAANLLPPVYDYLTQWLKIVGGLVWFTVAWTGWRLAEPRLRALASGRRRLAAAAACGAIVATAAWSGPEATRVGTAGEREQVVVQDLRDQVGGALTPDATYRVEQVADTFGYNAAGLIFYMIEDGYDVVTSDGAAGLKWGHTHRYEGDDYDVRLTVAVHYGGSWHDAVRECLADPRVELVAGYDELAPADRARLDDLKLTSLSAPETLTDADRAESRRLEAGAFRVGVFAGEKGCGARSARDRARD